MKQTIILILITFFKITVFSQAIEEKKVDELFKHWNLWTAPGCAIGVIKNDKVVLTKCYGMANLDNNIHIDYNTKFSIGSLTKQFTAYCIAILIYQDKLDLNDDIRKYLPDFPFLKDTLKIKHLIYHTNGLDDLSEMIKTSGYSYDDVINEQMIKEMIYSQKDLRFKPGEKFEYSNSGYYLLTEIIEKVTKLKINEFARRFIFNPLGMNDTYFDSNPGKVSNNLSFSYSQNIFGEYQKHYLNTTPIGSGNVISTLHDLLLWEQNFYNDKLYEGKLNNLILRRGILNKGDTLNYCFGLRIGKHKKYKSVIFHFGDFNSFISVIVKYPEKGLTVILLSNDELARAYFDNYSMADKVAEVFLDKDSNPKVPENRFKPIESEESIKKYIGNYKSKNGITAISYDEGNLKISHSWGNWYYSIFPESDSIFIDPRDFEYVHKFKIDENKNVIGLWTTHTGYMEKVRIDSIYSLSDDYNGSYYSKELNSVYQLFLSNGKIYCKINNKASDELIMTGKDMFRLKNNVIKAIHNDFGKFERLVVNNRYSFIKFK